MQIDELQSIKTQTRSTTLTCDIQFFVKELLVMLCQIITLAFPQFCCYCLFRQQIFYINYNFKFICTAKDQLKSNHFKTEAFGVYAFKNLKTFISKKNNFTPSSFTYLDQYGFMPQKPCMTVSAPFLITIITNHLVSSFFSVIHTGVGAVRVTNSQSLKF